MGTHSSEPALDPAERLLPAEAMWNAHRNRFTHRTMLRDMSSWLLCRDERAVRPYSFGSRAKPHRMHRRRARMLANVDGVIGAVPRDIAVVITSPMTGMRS